MIPKADSKMVLRAKAVVSREAGAVLKIAPQIDGRFVEIVEMLLGCNGHGLVAGVGTSAAVAERFAHLLSVCGTPAIFINVTNFLHGGSGAIRPEDILYVFSKGGQSDEINKLVKIAQLKKAKVIAQTENAASPLGNMADVAFQIRATGDVDPFGMMALGSSLVNCAACDALCAVLLEQRGYTQEEFGKTHPGGAVGKMFENDDSE